MPDVSRSDSQHSQDSSRPRVSFNRDVHVKRIGNGSAPREVGVSPSAAVRRQRPARLSRQALAKEAAEVLAQADRVRCTNSVDKFATVPARRRHTTGVAVVKTAPDEKFASLDRVKTRKKKAEDERRNGRSSDSEVTKKNAKTESSFGKSVKENEKVSTVERPKKKKSENVLKEKSLSENEKYSSLEKKKKKNLNKSASDTEKRNWKNSDSETPVRKKAKPLSPIIEAAPQDDYFDGVVVANNRVMATRGPTVQTIVRKLSQERAGRGPPRVAALVTPGDERKHNNNLPFSYTAVQQPTRPLHGPDQHDVIYAEVVCGGGGDGGPAKQTVHSSVSQMKDLEMHVGGQESRGRADGMDSSRRILQEEYRTSPVRRSLLEEFDDVIEPVIKPRHDLSLRRDRLESRIESQRKDRLMSSRLNDNSYMKVKRYSNNDEVDYKKYSSNPRLDNDMNVNKYATATARMDTELVKKYNSNPRLDNDSSRREFLNSQLVEGKQPLGKDKLTDSGIDIDYHNDLAGQYPAGSKIITEVKSYHNQVERKSATPSTRKYHSYSQPTLTNITKVDVNGHIQSDEEEEEEEAEMFFYNQQENVDQIRAKRALQNGGSADVLPASSKLIRNTASSGDKRIPDRPERKKTVGQGDIEESKRFIAEERRKLSDERVGTEAAPVKKVITKKKSGGAMEMVRAFFARGEKRKDTSRKSSKEEEVDQLRARYTEYRGSESGPRAPSRTKNITHTESSRRERLATPSPSPSRPSSQAAPSSGGWFKSLDRLTSRKKSRPKVTTFTITTGPQFESEIESSEVISEVDERKSVATRNGGVANGKSLRFFGDTDAESVRNGGGAAKQQRYVPLRDASNRRYKTSNNKLQVPRRRHHRSAGELATSSAESTTEGDSSQPSQRSVVYLHAATVGDIPGRAPPPRSNRRARSREELSSITTGSNLTPQTRTVSRSISVLAPWKPRHYRDPLEVHYENDSELQSRATKPPKVPTHYQKTSSSTLNRGKSSSRSYNSLSRGKDKENRASTGELSSNGYRSTTLKNSRPQTEAERKRKELARSMSMPKDSKVKSGWFRLRKK